MIELRTPQMVKWIKIHTAVFNKNKPDIFSGYKVRINGIEFHGCTTKFKEELAKERTWEKLNGDISNESTK